MSTRPEQQVLIATIGTAGFCRRCNNPIHWGTTVDGPAMPMEPWSRIKHLLQPSQRQRRTVRVGLGGPGQPRGPFRLTSERQEQDLLAAGGRVREELVEVWEFPASLTHWPNCNAARQRRG